MRTWAAVLVGSACLVAARAPLGADVVWPGAAWETSTPEAQGVDSGRLARLVDAVGSYRQDSLLVIRHGRIVLDAYYAPYRADIRHDLRSVTKSVTGTLIGIAVQHGMLDRAERPIVDVFADRSIENLDDAKRAMTVQHLLDMASGLAWKEQAYTRDEAVMQMYRSTDRTNFVLNRAMADPPGRRFDYNSGDSLVLSAVITKLAGVTTLEYAERELFAPLGITSPRWGQPDAQGIIDGGAGLHLTPHDMARIGYLYLRGGVWNGKRLIPESWVERARTGAIEARSGYHYANQWWSLPEKGAYMARGRHSQLILVLPKLDLVAVMTGILRDDEFYSVARMTDDVSAAVTSDEPLAADAVGRSVLEAALRRAATEPPSPVGETPALATAISGKVYRFGDNELRLRTLVLKLGDADPSWEITTAPEQADAAPPRFGGPMGLDGRARVGPFERYGFNAIKGTWINDTTFVVDRRILGQAWTQSWTLRFEGATVELAMTTTDGYKIALRGETTD
jgi:CubicO group peptidase (beta-lactamase class C family)